MGAHFAYGIALRGELKIRVFKRSRQKQSVASAAAAPAPADFSLPASIGRFGVISILPVGAALAAR